MNIEPYAQHLAAIIAAGNWHEIEKEIHGINLPDGWQEMVKGFYDDLAGKELAIEIVEVDDLPEQILHWLRMAPAEVLASTKQAVRLSYDESSGEDKNSGSLELAIFEREEGPFILMVGG